MVRLQSVGPAILLASLSGCSAEAQPPFKDAAACAAGYDYLLDIGKGTPLARDPHYAELKIRILFELDKLKKTEEPAESRKRIAAIRRKLNEDPKLAYYLASHCTAEAALTNDFEQARPRLESIADKKLKESES